MSFSDAVELPVGYPLELDDMPTMSSPAGFSPVVFLSNIMSTGLVTSLPSIILFGVKPVCRFTVALIAPAICW